MSIRATKQFTDRGSIKDIAKRLASSEEASELEMAPIPSELRMKKLYEYAQSTRDKHLQSSLGFITTDYIADKNALPLSAYRLRQVIDDIKSKSSGKIDELSLQLSGCLSDELSPETIDYLKTKRAMVKSASVRKPPAFWRASR